MELIRCTIIIYASFPLIATIVGITLKEIHERNSRAILCTVN